MPAKSQPAVCLRWAARRFLPKLGGFSGSRLFLSCRRQFPRPHECCVIPQPTSGCAHVTGGGRTRLASLGGGHPPRLHDGPEHHGLEHLLASCASPHARRENCCRASDWQAAVREGLEMWHNVPAGTKWPLEAATVSSGSTQVDCASWTNMKTISGSLDR